MYVTLRKIKDRFSNAWISAAQFFVFALPVAIFISLFYKSFLVMQTSGIGDLLFSSVWRPMAGQFGFYPFIISSLWITFLGLVITAPVCLLSAIYLTYYGSNKLSGIMQPVIDILAGIPSVIYGVWGVLIIVPFTGRYLAPLFGYESTGFSILAGGIVLAIMLIPFILNILIEVFRTVPAEQFEASLSLGATKWDSIKNVVIRRSFPGIVSAFGLGLSRAFGETIAVLMVVGNVVGIPENLFDPGYPLPALIANNYGEMLSIPMFDSALMFAALILFVVVVIFNMLSRGLIIYLEKRQ